MDQKISYSLDFYTESTLDLHAVYNTTGCASVLINGKDTRLAIGTKLPADFQAALSKTD